MIVNDLFRQEQNMIVNDQFRQGQSTLFIGYLELERANEEQDPET